MRAPKSAKAYSDVFTKDELAGLGRFLRHVGRPGFDRQATRTAAKDDGNHAAAYHGGMQKAQQLQQEFALQKQAQQQPAPAAASAAPAPASDGLGAFGVATRLLGART